MNKQLLCLAATLLSMAGAGTQAQEQSNVIRMPKAISCGDQGWHPEARRYALEGTTAVGFDLNDEGHPINLRIARSSGWKLLDGMSERSVKYCRYVPPTDPGVKRSGLLLGFKWELEPLPDGFVPAALVAGSCAASNQYAEFRPLSAPVQDGAGLLVRFLIDPAGKPLRVKVENPDSPASSQAAEAYIASCSFTPARDKSAPVSGSLFGRLIPKEA